MASTHYDMNLQLVSSGYVVPTGADADTLSAIMNDADTAVEEFTTALTRKLEADFDVVEDPQRGDNL